MFVIKIAGLKIAVENRFEFVKSICSGYITNENVFDFSVSVSESEISAEKKNYGDNISEGFTESVCIYRRIAELLPLYNAAVVHCAAIEYKGRAYCFAGKSGVGKTTHARLWKELLGNEVTFINGDKPIFRNIDGKIYVCGTPWGGKEGYNNDISVPLEAMCFLRQAPENSIYSIDQQDALGRIIRQTFIPKKKEDVQKTMDVIEAILSSARFYELNCTPETKAVELVLETLRNENATD